MQCARPCTPIPPLHACSMLTRWTLCCRSLLGRIWESKNIPHIVVGSASRSCGHCWGRGRARKALARGCGRCVLLPCSARRCPARKSPTHALCRRACVNGRGPLGGFHNYILILSNARGLQLDNSPSTLEFPESAADIAPSRVLGARRSCGAQWSWRRLIGSARGSSEHPVIVWYGGSLPRLKLARAGRRHTHLRPISALSEGAPNRAVEHPLHYNTTHVVTHVVTTVSLSNWGVINYSLLMTPPRAITHVSNSEFRGAKAST